MKTYSPHPVRRALVAVFALVACVASGAAADRKPNFVFIFTDDHRWDAMGVVQQEQDKQARFPWFKSPDWTGSRPGGCGSATPSSPCRSAPPAGPPS